MIPRKRFIFFLVDTPTGNVYYRSNTGTILLAPITAGSLDVTLKHSPANWLETSLEFQRNNNYLGIIRTYSQPHEYVKDAGQMIAELVLLGVGTETALTVSTYIYNSRPQTGEPTFKLYSKGNLDLNNLVATLLEGITVNTMEGGVSELMKSYEGTIVEIPCDGSLPEHIKCNYDGYLKQDTFYYIMVPTLIVQNDGAINNFLPINFTNNLGDNYGVVHQNSSLNQTNTLVEQDSNAIFYSYNAITARIRGYVVLDTTENNEPGNNYDIQVRILALKSTSDGVFSNIDVLVDTPRFHSQSRFDFDKTITLQPNEKLSIVMLPSAGAPVFHEMNLIDGSFNIQFVTKPPDSRAWGLTAYNLWQQIGKKICERASQSGITVDYKFESDQLQQYLNIFICSGDSLRASNDPLYQRYFTVDENQGTEFGPVIKTSLKSFHKSLTVLLMSAITMGHDSLGFEQLLFTSIENIFDSSEVTFSLGEVSSMKWAFSKNFRFTDLEIGYEPQSYDQVSGKYEPNTKLKMKAPVIRGESQLLSLVSDYRTDTTGIERLRVPATSGASTSTTRNDSDGSVFMTDIDRENFIYDYFRAIFNSGASSPTDPDHINYHLENSKNHQLLNLPSTDGGYFRVNTDHAIFVFNQGGYSATESVRFQLDGFINASNPLPGSTESIGITLYRNGLSLYSTIVNVSSVNTPIVIDQTISQLFTVGDTFYVGVTTTPGCEAQINTVSVEIGTYVIVSGGGIPVSPGTPKKLLSMISVSAPVVSHGFQYFMYNSNSYYNNFNYQLGLNGFSSGQVATLNFYIYVNGVSVSATPVTTSVPLAGFITASAILNRSFITGDIVFITASNGGNSVDANLMTATLSMTSPFVKCYSLFRELYDSFQGLPNVAPTTASPGAPYNIRFSPGRCRDKWIKYFNSCFLDHVTGPLKFQSLSKNPYLLTVKDGVTVKENDDKTLLNDGRIAYPIVATITTNVLSAFAELCSSTINVHVHWKFMGRDFYGFANKLSQKPALDEPQTWDLLLSPLNDLNVLAKITSFKLPTMLMNSIYISKFSPVQFVDYNRQVIDTYHTRNRDEFLFREQLTTWKEKVNYVQPVQIGDEIQLQLFSKGADPVAYTIHRCDGSIFLGPTNLNTIVSPSVPQTITDPIVLWQTIISTTGWERGNYYIVLTAALQKVAISELLGVRPKQELDGTVFLETFHSENFLDMVFDGVSPYRPKMRVWGGFDNRFKQKFIAKNYINQSRDVAQLRAILYETTNFFLGRDYGVPDYVSKKTLGFMLMDNFSADGERFALEGNEWETKLIDGVPMKYQTIEITPAENRTGVNIPLPGIVDTDNSLVVLINQHTLGPNVTNQSGTTEVDLIEITITN